MEAVQAPFLMAAAVAAAGIAGGLAGSTLLRRRDATISCTDSGATATVIHDTFASVVDSCALALVANTSTPLASTSVDVPPVA